MRTILLTAASALVFGGAFFLQAESPQHGEAIKVRLRLVDESTGKGVAGIVRVFARGNDQPLSLAGLADRLRGLERSATSGGWYVVPADGGETTLPRTALRLEALSGLETTLARQEVDLSKGDVDQVTVKLTSLFRPEEDRLFAGNTHLHLRDLTREEADAYLRQLPVADGLKVLFISYLERHKDDEHYVTNRYPVGPLPGLETAGVLVSNGEEHRHNFEAYGPGYGHVMFLDIRQLVRPVSLGPGITGGGDDDRPLRGGMDDARRQGGTVIWCHNTTGFEAAPAALAGRLDALNVFDGSPTGGYEERYYRFLNVGLRLPISTGTDWFLYDFARVYARVPDKLTVQSWLGALKAGRCVATNGPRLILSVDGHEVGDVLHLDRPRTVRVEATGLGRQDFERLQLVQNGKVIQTTQAASRKDGGYSARLVREVRIDEPAWFAARIEARTKNELDRRLYAHSSPVYVDLAGKRVFDVEAARGLQRELEEARDAIRTRGRFSTPQARDKLLALYGQAENEVLGRINQRGK
jgi:hypothetical protein